MNDGALDNVTLYALNLSTNVGRVGLRKDNFANPWFTSSITNNPSMAV